MYHKTWWHMDGVWATVEESPDVVSEVVACFGRLFHFHLREKDLRKGVSFLSQLLWSLPLIILHKDRIRDHFVEEVQGFGVGHVILFLMTHCAIVRGCAALGISTSQICAKFQESLQDFGDIFPFA